MKMAAAEALWRTEDPASFSLLTIGDLSQRKDVFSIRIPRLLSLLAYNQVNGEVKGIFDLQAEFEQTFGPGDYIPPIAITYWTFRIMVGAGVLLGLLGLFALFLAVAESFDNPPLVWRLFIFAIALPYFANTAGWIMTELGRLPWVVYGLMKLEEGISPTVSAGMVLTTLIVFTLVYAALMVANIYLLKKFAVAGPKIPTGENLNTSSEFIPAIVGSQD